MLSERPGPFSHHAVPFILPVRKLILREGKRLPWGHLQVLFTAASLYPEAHYSQFLSHTLLLALLQLVNCSSEHFPDSSRTFWATKDPASDSPHLTLACDFCILCHHQLMFTLWLKNCFDLWAAGPQHRSSQAASFPPPLFLGSHSAPYVKNLYNRLSVAGELYPSQP